VGVQRAYRKLAEQAIFSGYTGVPFLKAKRVIFEYE
jgi:hypothetical protein